MTDLDSTIPSQAAYDAVLTAEYGTEWPTGENPADRPRLTDAIMRGIAAADSARDTYLQGVLDAIVTEAAATKGRLRLGIATAILIIDRFERGILGPDEAVRLFDLADSIVCGEARITRQCPQGHHWVTATTSRHERFELPIKTEAHR